MTTILRRAGRYAAVSRTFMPMTTSPLRAPSFALPRKFAAGAVLAVLPLLAAAQAPAPAAPAAPQVVPVGQVSSVPAPTVAAKAWLALDVNSGQVLASSNAEQPIEPASLTKLMTAYVAFQALKEKRISLEQQATVSENAWRTGGSRMFIEPRKPVTVDQLLQGVIVQSGNDASVALSETVAGSASAFVSLMNQEAERLGMKNTHFMNVDGLPDPQHRTTVHDLAILAMHLVSDFPEYYHYYSQREFTYNNIKQANRNRLLWADPSIDGMKTGHTETAGYCLVATALRGDRRVVSVVVGTDSEATRAEESLKLLNWSFQNFDTVKFFDGAQASLQAKVWEGKTDVAKLGPSHPVWLTVPRGKGAEIKPEVQRIDPLVAPLDKGLKVGTVALTLGDKALRVEPLVVLEPVERAGFFGRMVDVVKRWFQ